RRQLDLLAKRNGVRNKPALLVASINGDYNEPAERNTGPDSDRASAPLSRRELEESRAIQQQAENRARAEEYIAALSAEERALLDAEARSIAEAALPAKPLANSIHEIFIRGCSRSASIEIVLRRLWLFDEQRQR